MSIPSLTFGVPLYERLVLIGGVDPVVADDGLDDGDLVAVFEGAELFEFLGLLQRGRGEGDVLQQEVPAVGVQPRVFEVRLASPVCVRVTTAWDQAS